MMDYPLAETILSKNLNYLSKFVNVIFSDFWLKPTEKFNFFLKYKGFKSIEDIYSYVTNDKDIVFKKEIKNYLYENIFTVYGNSKTELYVLNTHLIEPMYIVFNLAKNGELKSLKEVLEYVSKIQKFSFNDYNMWSISSYGDITQEILRLVKNCKNNSDLKTINKLNVPVHMFEKYNDFLEENSLTVDLTKHKKFEYPFTMLSKRFSKGKIKNFILPNKNAGYNETNSSFFKIVKDWNELFDIGIELSNCSGNYESKPYYVDCFNFVVKDGDKKYLGCIKKGQLSQLKGFKNSSPSKEFALDIYKKLLKENYIDKDVSFKSFYQKCQHEFV